MNLHDINKAAAEQLEHLDKVQARLVSMFTDLNAVMAYHERKDANLELAEATAKVGAERRKCLEFVARVNGILD